MDNAEKLLDCCKRIESAYEAMLGSHKTLAEIERSIRDPKTRQLFNLCREVRNVLSHQPKLDGAYLLQPSDQLVGFLEGFIKSLEEPETCGMRAVPRSKILSCCKEDKIAEVSSAMKEKGFSCAPVLDDGHVVGIVNGTSLFNYIAEKGALEANTTVGQLGSFLELDNQGHTLFKFYTPSTPIEQMLSDISTQSQANHRIQAAFITAAGTQKNRLLGMLTPWDVL